MEIHVESQTVQHLMREHEFLRKLLRTIEALLDGVERHAPVSREDLALLIDCIGDFSYLRHEEKEESLLLPALERLGMEWESGPLPHVRREHRQERYLLRSLRHSAMQSDEWDEEDRRHFLSIGRELLEFTRRHLESEEAYLFPEAEARLTPELDRKLVEQFVALDRDLDAARDSRTLRERAAEVLERLAGAGSSVAMQSALAPSKPTLRH